MKRLRSIWKWWHQIWQHDDICYGQVDSHNWDNKIEMFYRLKS